MSTAITCAPSRANTSAIVAPMPRAAPVTTRDLAVERLVPVGRRGGIGRADPEHLTVDVGRLARQQESQRGLQARRGRLGVRREIDQGHRGPVAQFLAQRAGEPLEGALRDVLVHVADVLRRGPDHDDARRVAEVAQQRGEEFVERLEARRFGDAGGVEHQPAEPIRPPAAEIVGDHVVVLGQGGAQRLDHAALAADQQRAGQRRLALLVAAQRLGLRDAELLGQEGSGTGVDDLGEEIGSHSAAFLVTGNDRMVVLRPVRGTRTVGSITNLLQSKNRG